jgi:uncharacterized protein (TIGR02466 family)
MTVDHILVYLRGLKKEMVKVIDDFKLFPTLVRKVNNFLSVDECSTIQKELLDRESLLKDHELLTGKSKSSHLIDNILNIISINLNDRIKDICWSYKKDVGFNMSNEISDSWFNIQKKGTALQEHTHPNSILSGALYINVDQDSNQLYFHNPNQFMSFCDIEEHKECSYNWFYFKPRLGSLIIFPSWLKHGSNETKNNTENRTVISFNVK